METVNTKKNIRLKDYIKDIDDKVERRYFHEPLGFVEVETNGAKAADENQITGYAAVFNRDSEDFGGFVERIAPGAFTSVLEDDAFAYLNHSINHPLGRNKVNMTLTQDEIGLKYVIKLPDTTDGNNVKALVRAGIIYKSSFAFTVQDESFRSTDKGMPDVRTIVKIGRLYDVSPLSTDPAYPDTSVAARSFQREKAKEEIQQALTEQQLRITYRFMKHKFNYNTRLNKN